MGRIYKNKLELLGLGNFMGNVYKVISGEILNENAGQNKMFSRNEQIIATCKINFTST